MQIILIKPDKLYKYDLNNQIGRSYWIKDFDDSGNERDLISVKKKENTWILYSNENCYVEENSSKSIQTFLTINTFFTLKIKTPHGESTALLYLYNENEETIETYMVADKGEYSIGSGQDCYIVIADEYVAPNHAVLYKGEKGYAIKSNDPNYGIYVNGTRIDSTALEIGDTIYILGYSIIVLNDYIIVNNTKGKFRVNTLKIVKKSLPKYRGELLKTVDDDNALLYDESQYFSRQPRFITSVEDEVMSIDSPPGAPTPDDTPILYTLGPMLTMTLTSAITAASSISNLLSSESTWVKIAPGLVISVSMIASTLLWPTLIRRYTKKKQEKNEEERQKKYREYLLEKRNKIESIRHSQHQVLLENYPEPKYLQNIIINKRRNLWERQLESGDFLNVRVGTGTIPLRLQLNYATEDFAMSKDNLKQELEKIGEASKDIPNCPVTVSLTARNKLVIIGENKKYRESMLKSIILQLCTYHAYNDLKLVFMVNDSTSNMWKDFKVLPHVWSDARDIRFYANNFDDMTKLSFYLEQVFVSRKNEATANKEVHYSMFNPYYLIITDNIKKVKNVDIVDKILNEDNNLGFGVLVLNKSIADLPNDINDFLTVDGANSVVMTNDLNKNNQQPFIMDSMDNINMSLMCEKLSNIPIKSDAILSELKNSVGFLEMCKVGRVEQLNVLAKWEASNPVNSLSVPIGVRNDGELFTLDLHEKFHGPHGLIAGMTGSGKSEFIITYILSMCLNFSPEEVSFVLIDYKGGGLTGAFENKLTGVRLPHLAGTITNLDTAEIKRSLSSIHSELTRRQELFNKAKAKLNESTLDIYKYQQLYRDGAIDEPISHLFIISDEFAELKAQQPDFMDELISTARIGRSLGVHLILSTQKPSGIVDDQIWSNSKFRVCLKVQEKADSMDVIKCPDAVELKKAGRFYLQVGYNDYFARGQSASAGTKYIPRDEITKTVDRDISVVNNIGDIVRNIETSSKEDIMNQGEELPNVLKYICDEAKKEGIVARKLWLDKIPAEIFVTNLMRKYAFNAEPWNIKAIVGEYDDPNSQMQGLLTLDFNETGNTLIYGTSGKEIMLSSIIYSLIISHTPDELNIYIVDFGTEMFGTFKNAPQVGDVIYITEEEKFANLFATLSKELEKRKRLFVEYNGSYSLYVKSSPQKLPRIMIVINNYELLTENFEEYSDVISSMSREGEKYGIFFVITATGVTAVRGKTAQNFSNQLCLQFNDPSDYSAILGPTRGLVPSSIEGRGLVKLENGIFEFQTAYPYKWEEIGTFIKNICNQLNEKVKKKAQSIAILPTHVRIQDIDSCITDIKSTPIGVEKDSLAVSTFNFAKSPVSLVSAQDISILEKFIPSLGQVFQNMYNVTLHMIDVSDYIKDISTFSHYYNSENSAAVVDVLESLINNPIDKDNIFIIYGLEAFMATLQGEYQNRFKSFVAGLKSVRNVKFIFADAVGKLKMYEYDDFFKSNVQPINAIWIGSGITDQFTIKSSTYNKQTRSQIENDFGYNVDKGNAKFIKVLDFYTEE